MSDILRRYRQVDYRLPATYLSWDLFGAGLEHLGRDKKPVELPLREPRADELLLRVDAIGLCFSDTKLVWAGNDHPRIRGRDLMKDPTVPGHEAALTVVKVGADWKSKFSLGQRFIIQADVFVKGEQRAFGYVQRGALAQFAYAGPEVLAGDDGCYLLPMAEHTGYAEAALVEPWACVEGAYHIKARTAPKAGGRALIVAAQADSAANYAGLYPAGGEPVLLAVLGHPAAGWEGIKAAKVERRPESPLAAAVAELAAKATGGDGFDDLFLLGDADPELLAACDAALAKNGHLVLSGGKYGVTALDIGRVHYHYTRHLGATGGVLLSAYTANTRTDLVPKGACWMAGAAGPMGQMHVQRALEVDRPPRMVYCSDLSQERLDYMEKRLAPLAKRAGVDLRCVNVKSVPDFEKAVAEAADGKGFDDVYVHAPVAPVVEQCARHMGDKGILNIFAGVALGTMAKIDPAIFAQKHVRMIGSSGSSMDDIKSVLAKVESGKLATRMSLAALGGIEAAWMGLKGVKENAFLGKTVLFPAAKNLPLLPVDRLGEASPAAASKLENGAIWTLEAENVLLAEQVKID